MPKRGKRAHSDNEMSSGSEDSDTPVLVNLGESVTMTKREWLARGHELLERAWYDMVQQEKAKEAVKAKLIREQQQQIQQLQQGTPRTQSGNGNGVGPQQGQGVGSSVQGGSTTLQEQASVAR